MLKVVKYVFGFIIITAVGILYEKYKLKYYPDEELDQIDIINKHLLGEDNYNNQRPILWIHSDDLKNSRNRGIFSSRENENCNPAYLDSCLEAIINHCGESFNICLLDDSSFDKLLPRWNISVNNIPSPIREHVRTLALTKLLYKYGGMLLPDSTIVLKDLISLYINGIKDTGGVL